jgi:regulator of protease activity HflC (stomatin/prohibitin superfamily)
MFDRLIDTILTFIHLFQFWTVLADYEIGVLLRFGKFSRIMTPGLHLIMPFKVDTVLTDNNVPKPLFLKSQSLTTEDGVGIVVSANVAYGITDPRPFLLEIEGGESMVTLVVQEAIARIVTSYTWDDIVEDTGSILEEIYDQVEAQVKPFGAYIHTLAWRDVVKTRTYRIMQATEDESSGIWLAA